MRAVNLLPPAQRSRPGLPTGSVRAPLAVAGAVVALGAMGWWGYSLHGQVGDVKSDVTAATAERDQLRTEVGAYQAAQARQATQDLRRGAVVGLVAGRTNWERLVRDLATVMPRQVWLTELSGEAEPAVDTATVSSTPAPNTNNSAVPKGIHLDGFAYNQRQVAQLMARAATVPGLGEPRLATSEVQPMPTRNVVHFVIDIPIDQRAQDRPTLTQVDGAATSGGTGETS
jgi:Tfp pilus assembly protein PilN